MGRCARLTGGHACVLEYTHTHTTTTHKKKKKTSSKKKKKKKKKAAAPRTGRRIDPERWRRPARRCCARRGRACRAARPPALQNLPHLLQLPLHPPVVERQRSTRRWRCRRRRVAPASTGRDKHRPGCGHAGASRKGGRGGERVRPGLVVMVAVCGRRRAAAGPSGVEGATGGWGRETIFIKVVFGCAGAQLRLRGECTMSQCRTEPQCHGAQM
jgi:hypothetical protein